MADSTAEDLRLPEKTSDIKQNPDAQLSAEQVRREVSIIARTLIFGYCGWPFHKEIVKRKVLKGLCDTYDNARDMKVGKFFDQVGAALREIPDSHIRLEMGNKRTWCKHKHKYKNVGKNLAAKDESARLEKQGNIAVIAIYSLYRKDWMDKYGTKEGDIFLEPFKEGCKKILEDAAALIVDLRGNGGGTSNPTNWLANYLYGANAKSCVKSYMRATDEGGILQSIDPNTSWSFMDRTKDPAVSEDNTEKPQPEFASKTRGYAKPIYILIDRKVCSSAEMFITRLKHHPYMKLVGDNTAGCEVFGNMRSVYLPHSRMELVVGIVYRELEQENFELNGYAPDIECREGEDAFDMAMKEIGKSADKINPALLHVPKTK